MAKLFLTFDQNARLFGWLYRNGHLCEKLTGKDPKDYISKPITDRDVGPLPYSHTTFPPSVQWWVNKHCPYPYGKTEDKVYRPLLAIKDWYWKRKKLRK